MATNTYVALDKVTVASAVSSITFSSIPSGYTDLVIVFSGSSTLTDFFSIRFNNDSGSNYSLTDLYGTGSAAYSTRQTNQTKISRNECVGQSSAIIQINNYSNTTTYKATLSRSNSATDAAFAVVGLWRSTAAINRVDLIHDGSTFVSGSTFELYGIRAEGVSPTTKATGGAVYSDSTYYYHVFAASGTFTPTQSITADVLQVAGGGGGAGVFQSAPFCAGGGAGAGGLLLHSTQSLTATNYTVTVGAGGSGGSSAGGGSGGQSGTKGTSSQFGALTASVGGGAGLGRLGADRTIMDGGSGGGGATDTGFTPDYGIATSGQGNNGGEPYPSSTSRGGGGGGGAGAAGGRPNANTQGGAGGNGTTSYSTWSAATGIGENILGTYYIAGGGGGGGGAQSTAGIAGYGGGGSGSSSNALQNMGGGGGGATQAVTGGNGGSGVIIVRYAK